MTLIGYTMMWEQTAQATGLVIACGRDRQVHVLERALLRELGTR